MRMRDARRWRISYRALAGGQIVLGVLVPCMAALGKVPKTTAEELGPVVDWLVDFCERHTEWSVVVAAALIGIAQVLRRCIGSPKLWPTLHKVLDEFREDIFSDIAGDPLHEHRVTLFKRVQWGCHLPCLWRPWNGWLIPVIRSGHTTQSTSTVFPAPDAADKAQGVAGEAWKGSFVWIEGLPDVAGNATDEDTRVFAETTCVPEKWVRKHRPNRRSYGGLLVEVRGKPWGVIVLDSTNPTGLKPGKRKAFQNFAKNVGRILEGAQR